jgi:hypothetical protein
MPFSSWKQNTVILLMYIVEKHFIVWFMDVWVEPTALGSNHGITENVISLWHNTILNLVLEDC